MAIKMNTEFAGVEVIGAYARAEDFNGTKNGMDVQLVYYASQDAANDGTAAFLREQYPFIPDVSDESPNYHKQFYSHIKSMPKFEPAVDC